MKKIISYNLNGIRAALGKNLIGWINEQNADIICFQETKAQPEQIPIYDFEAAGYHSYWFSAKKKGYSGVGILSKIKPKLVTYGMGYDKYDNEGRVIRAEYNDISVMSVYHPSGTTGDIRQAFKMEWLDDFLTYTNELRKLHPNLIIAGDFNICHKAIDIHDPKGNANSSGFLPEEREWMSKFIDSGFIDTFRHFNKEPHNYTWWSFRANARERNLGWRIDYEMVTNSLASIIKQAEIFPMAKHSDHCPISLYADF